MTVLIIDDEVQIRRLLRLALDSRGWTVREAENGTLGLQEAVFHKPDAIVLDLGLPDMDGLDVLRRLREWSDVPVLILSVRDQESLKVSALDRGADDYVTKPFGTAELLSRLRAICRRRTHGGESALTLGHLHLDFASRSVTAHGGPVHLTPTEYALLRLLAQNAGKVVTQKRLLHDVWGPQAADQTHYLRVFVNQLRKKLALTPASDVTIQTEPGIGYRLTTSGDF